MEIINTIRQNIKNHHVSAYSGQMAFFLVMSVFPFLIVLFTLIGKFSLDSELLLEYAKIFIPVEISVFLEDYITKISFNTTGVISISLLVTLWSSSRAVHSMMRSFNVVFEVKENRNYLQLRFIGFFYTIMLVIAIILFLFLLTIGRSILDFFNPLLAIPEIYLSIYSVLRWVFITIFFFFGILILYTKLPNKVITFKQAIPGAFLALFGWLANSLLYSFAITNFGRISIVYGGLSASILLSFWFYINSAIVILGAEVIYYLQNKE